MREILFRGKPIRGGDWLYGHYTEYKGVAQIWVGTEDDGQWNNLVDPATVGQYIGLTDKHGKRIFEGDIIKGRRTKAYAVEYSQNIAGFIARGIGILSVPCMNPGTMMDYEIIGNIHDNPELFEKEVQGDG